MHLDILVVESVFDITFTTLISPLDFWPLLGSGSLQQLSLESFTGSSFLGPQQPEVQSSRSSLVATLPCRVFSSFEPP